MKIFALADFHLSFGIKNKGMEVFGDHWKNWTAAIEKNCHEKIQEEDLLLIAGDISWAMKFEDALVDLNWIAKLPGKKVITRGNHDYWWASLSKMQTSVPDSIYFIHNNSVTFDDVTIGGVRLWDSPEFNFQSLIEIKENPLVKKETRSQEELEQENKKIYQRELARLQMSLDTLCKTAKYRIAMVHYPPIGTELKETQASKLLESYHIDHCVFGHLHNLKTKEPLFGALNGVEYHLTSCDYLDFSPKLILDR